MFKKKANAKEMPVQESTASNEQATQNGLPLFYKNPAMLHSDRHANAGLRANLPAHFARGTNSLPISIGEIAECAKSYPIAFAPGEVPMPIVIVGLEEENLFLSADGSWEQNSYIPAYVRQYPFIFVEVPQENKLALCVDEGGEHFTLNAGENDLKFFENGEPTQFTRDALGFCEAFKRDHEVTRHFAERVASLGILEANSSSIELPSGRKIGLGGFLLVNEEKLRALPDEVIVSLHKEGILPLVYYCLLATGNWRRLLDLAAKREAN